MSTDYQFTHVPLNRAKPKRGPTPEAKVSAACDRYLKKIGAITIRTNAGAWQDEQGNVIMGAKAGTSDKTVCLPGGAFCAVECKAGRNGLSDAQKRYQVRVEALGGIYIVARSAADLRGALITLYGAAVVEGWEAKK